MKKVLKMMIGQTFLRLLDHFTIGDCPDKVTNVFYILIV